MLSPCSSSSTRLRYRSWHSCFVRSLIISTCFCSLPIWDDSRSRAYMVIFCCCSYPCSSLILLDTLVRMSSALCFVLRISPRYLSISSFAEFRRCLRRCSFCFCRNSFSSSLFAALQRLAKDWTKSISFSRISGYLLRMISLPRLWSLSLKIARER